MGGRERPGAGGGSGRGGVSTRLYQSGPTQAPRFFPWGCGVGRQAGIIKLVKCLLCALHCPGSFFLRYLILTRFQQRKSSYSHFTVEGAEPSRLSGSKQGSRT